MNIAEIVMLTSIAWVSVIAGVLSLRAMSESKWSNKHNQKLELSLSMAKRTNLNMESHDSVLTATNVVSMSDFLARKNATQPQSTQKIHSKETRIIYPLKKL